MKISYDLFVALVEYHLAYDDDYAEEIHRGLEQMFTVKMAAVKVQFQMAFLKLLPVRIQKNYLLH